MKGVLFAYEEIKFV